MRLDITRSKDTTLIIDTTSEARPTAFGTEFFVAAKRYAAVHAGLTMIT